MAQHVHTTYTCDRCKCDLGTTRPKRDVDCIVEAHFPSIQKSSHHFKWNDLCDSCDVAVKAFFLTSPVSMNVTGSERREARIWWAEVGAYVNTEMAEYIMVRVRRIMGGWKP